VVVVESPEPRKVSRFLDEQTFVHSTAQIGNTLRVMVDRNVQSPAEFTDGVIRGAGLALDGCEKVRPSLEDVFVAATQARKAARDKAE
jgi:ABC-2 type transport system ATP-binding protein